MDNSQRDRNMARKIAEKVSESGGNTYFVGGCVRDELRGCEVKDFDIEIHGIEPSELEDILDHLSHATTNNTARYLGLQKEETAD